MKREIGERECEKREIKEKYDRFKVLINFLKKKEMRNRRKKSVDYFQKY